MWLTDPEAGNYPFPHRIGERLKSPTKNFEGIVRNAKYAGTEDGGPSWITYYMETDTGEIIQLPSAGLEKVGQPIHQGLFFAERQISTELISCLFERETDA